MGKFPLLFNRKQIGNIEIKQETLYSCFTACGHVPEDGLWCVWVVGEQGELRLGVMEPVKGEAMIHRRYSTRMTAPVGRILHGEVRPSRECSSDWEAVSSPERLFGTLWLRGQLQGTQGALARKKQNILCLALPYDRKAPFILSALFCFAEIRRIGGGEYAVFRFDKNEQPVFHG